MNENNETIIKCAANQTIAISVSMPCADDVWKTFTNGNQAFEDVFIGVLKGAAKEQLTEAGYEAATLDYLNSRGPIFRKGDGNVRAVFFGQRTLKEGDELWALRDDDPEGTV